MNSTYDLFEYLAIETEVVETYRCEKRSTEEVT